MRPTFWFRSYVSKNYSLPINYEHLSQDDIDLLPPSHTIYHYDPTQPKTQTTPEPIMQLHYNKIFLLLVGLFIFVAPQLPKRRSDPD